MYEISTLQRRMSTFLYKKKGLGLIVIHIFGSRTRLKMVQSFQEHFSDFELLTSKWWWLTQFCHFFSCRLFGMCRWTGGSLVWQRERQRCVCVCFLFTHLLLLSNSTPVSSFILLTVRKVPSMHIDACVWSDLQWLTVSTGALSFINPVIMTLYGEKTLKCESLRVSHWILNDSDTFESLTLAEI